MNTQTRSKILAIGVAGALLAGASLPLLPLAIAHAEAQASSSTTLLDRGLQLINQHEYQTAKQVLLSIDPAKLNNAEQTRLASLLQKADTGLAGMSADLTVYHNATASLQDGHLAHAAKLFQYIINSPEASTELKSEAADNLALTQARQQQLAPQMKSLLRDAVHAYQAGNYDQAAADLNKIQVSGADLGGQAAMISHYQYLIAQRRVQQVHELEAAQQAKVAAAQKIAEEKVAARQKLLAQENAMAQQKAAAEKLAAQQKAAELDRLAAAKKMATEKKQQELAQAAAAAKLAEQQKEAQQKLLAQEAAAKKLAQEQQAQQAKAAVAARLAEQQKLAAEKAAHARQLAEEKMRVQRAAAEKASAAKIVRQQQLAQQQLLTQQQTQEQQAEQARQAAAVAVAAAAAQQAAAQQAHIAATQKAAQQAAVQQARIAAKQKTAEEARRVKAREVAAKPAPAAIPAPAPTVVVAPAPAATVARPSPTTTTTTTTTTAPVVRTAMPAPMPAVIKPSLAEIERERSAALVVKADQDLRNADYQQAVSLYNDALALDPKNEAAAMGLRNAQKLSMGQSPGLLSEQIYNQAIQAQRAHVLFDNDLQLSSNELQAGKYPQAVDHANDALATIEAARGILTAGDYTRMKDRANEQIAIIQSQQAQAQAIQQARRSREVTQSQMKIEQQLSVRRQQQINQLMGQAREYFKQMQYQQSLDTLNQVIAIDPQNNTAQFMHEMVQDQIQYNAWNKYHTERSLATQEQQVKAEEFMIPYPNLEIYPQDWPELSRMREAEKHNSESPADREARLALAKNVSKIVVNQQPFSSVVNLLRQQTGANIVVNWNALANAGVQKQTPISLTLRGVPFEKVLSLVLQQAQGSGGTQLGYSISGGVLTISTNDQLAQQKNTRIFDIQDLLVQAPNFTAPTFNLQNQSSNSGVQVSSGSSGGASSGGSSNLFSGSAGQGAGQQAGKTRAQMVTEITQLIENTVARTSWIDNGGTVGSIREINGQLVITQTPNNLQKVSGLLRQLRETRSIEISIDTRFLYVTTGFLNDFGFSWSLGFNGNFFGSGNSIQPLKISNNTTTYTAPQKTGVPNSIGSTYQSGSPSLGITGGILSNYQLSLLLNATQINSRNTLLEAPRVTLFNGQRATMVVEDVQNYVESFTQTAGTGGVIGGVSAIATNLSVAPLTTGLSLQVQATVSSDNRYVIMTIEPSLSQLLSLQTFDITGNIAGSAGAANTTLPGFVQLPDTQITEVQTTVSVPDGGTLLLGGERLAGETTVEAGVPILSQIPIVNRLFTNRSTTKDNVVLLILVRPHIIIQKEYEKKQFGRNY